MTVLSKSLRNRDRFFFGLFVILLLYALFGILRLYPIVLSTGYLGFRNYNLIGTKNSFVGLRNYIQLVHDPSFIRSLKNTIIIAAVTMPVSVVISLSLGLFYSKKCWGSRVFQLIYFIPALMPTTAVALIWKWMYETDGIINYLLSLIGLGAVPWLTNPAIAVWSVVILWVWKWVGYYAIIFMYGLQNIPNMYYEASRIDGASGLQQFSRITLPLLKPTTIVVMVIATTFAFQIFEPVYVLTTGSQGAFLKGVKVIVYDMYTNYFDYWKVGYAAAEGTILFLIIFIVSRIQTLSMRMGKEQ